MPAGRGPGRGSHSRATCRALPFRRQQPRSRRRPTGPGTTAGLRRPPAPPAASGPLLPPVRWPPREPRRLSVPPRAEPPCSRGEERAAGSGRATPAAQRPPGLPLTAGAGSPSGGAVAGREAKTCSREGDDAMAAAPGGRSLQAAGVTRRGEAAARHPPPSQPPAAAPGTAPRPGRGGRAVDA